MDGHPRMSEEAGGKPESPRKNLLGLERMHSTAGSGKLPGGRLGQGSEHHREHKGGADGWRESAESLRKVSRGQKSPGAPGSEEGSGEEQRV